MVCDQLKNVCTHALCTPVLQVFLHAPSQPTLWLKLNLIGRDVPFDFIEKAVKNGCQYLDLSESRMTEVKKSEFQWKLKYLDVSLVRGDLAGVLQNCHFLQKLAAEYLTLNSDEIDNICQNGNTLKILSLIGCNIDCNHRTELIRKLLTSCPQLTELNIQDMLYGCALVENLPATILKLDLSDLNVNDKHVRTLVSRCKKITELDLGETEITNDSLASIIEHLKFLEKLDVSYTYIDFSMLRQLKGIPTLKILRCLTWKKDDIEKIKNLKLQLPHVSINEGFFDIARPANYLVPDWQDWLWEIKTKKQDLFSKN